MNYKYFEIANIKTFVLISKCDFDLLKQHNNPYTLNCIYTPRRAGPLVCFFLQNNIRNTRKDYCKKMQNRIPQHAEIFMHPSGPICAIETYLIF